MATKGTKFDMNAKYVSKQYGALVGRTIKEIRPMYEEELKNFDWDDYSSTPLVIILDDGTVLIPSSDPEGNQAGHLFVESLEEA